MRKLMIMALMSLCTVTFASLPQALIDVSEQMTDIKEECGSTILGQINTHAMRRSLLLYSFDLGHTVMGEMRHICRVEIKVDSRDVPVDGAVVTTLSHKRIK